MRRPLAPTIVRDDERSGEESSWSAMIAVAAAAMSRAAAMKAPGTARVNASATVDGGGTVKRAAGAAVRAGE